MEHTKKNCETLWSISFVSSANQKLNRMVLAEADCSEQKIKSDFAKKFSHVKEITHVDEWDSVIVLH